MRNAIKMLDVKDKNSTAINSELVAIYDEQVKSGKQASVCFSVFTEGR